MRFAGVLGPSVEDEGETKEVEDWKKEEWCVAERGRK